MKYYSGTATYHTSFTVDATLENTQKFYLDLGAVSIAARVIVNGKDLGLVWKAPFELDVTSALKEGVNDLSIEVTNLWTNRLIGDETLPDNSGYHKGDQEMPAWYTASQPQPEGP